jgi:cellulose synthase/poly-beta-1,6-N-acetylglucosamine synthase-like glycosyltransferase
LENEETDGKIAFPSVSIIVATHNSESTVDECLRSILELDYPKKLFEVIVIDGGSNDLTVERVKAHPVKLISHHLNAPESYNYVLKTVENEVVGFIDSDAKVESQWLKKLIKHLENPKVAGAGGNIETWNKNKLIPRCVGYELTYRYRRLPREVLKVATMNFIVKKKMIDEVGGFNESLPTQYDTDLGVRIVRSGYKLIFDSDVTCYHFHRPTLSAFFKQQFKYGQNTWKVYFRYPHLVEGDQITDWWMNVQPILYVVGAISLVASLIPNFNQVGMWIFLSLAFLMTLQYAFSAARISLIFHDLSAMFLIVLYFTRAVAWTLGGTTSFVSSFFTRGGG